MIKKTVIVLVLFIMFLNSISVSAEDFKYVEIFDPKQDKVVKVVQLNPEIQNMVTSWILNIQGVCGKIDPTTDDGYAVKVPLDPAVSVKNNTLNAVVKEVFIIIPENEPPFFMIFEDENKLSSFLFNGDIDKLSKSLDFKLKSTK